MGLQVSHGSALSSIPHKHLASPETDDSPAGLALFAKPYWGPNARKTQVPKGTTENNPAGRTTEECAASSRAQMRGTTDRVSRNRSPRPTPEDFRPGVLIGGAPISHLTANKRFIIIA